MYHHDSDMERISESYTMSSYLEEENLRYLQKIDPPDDNNQKPATKASNLRCLYSHFVENRALSNGRKNNERAPELVQATEKCLSSYADVVDRMDDKGLNNFAEGALALCCHHKNDSSKWKTSLNVENILQMCQLGSEEEDYDDRSDDDSQDSDIITLFNPNSNEKVTEKTVELRSNQSKEDFFKSSHQSQLSCKANLSNPSPIQQLSLKNQAGQNLNSTDTTEQLSLKSLKEQNPNKQCQGPSRSFSDKQFNSSEAAHNKNKNDMNNHHIPPYDPNIIQRTSPFISQSTVSSHNKQSSFQNNLKQVSSFNFQNAGNQQGSLFSSNFNPSSKQQDIQQPVQGRDVPQYGQQYSNIHKNNYKSPINNPKFTSRAQENQSRLSGVTVNSHEVGGPYANYGQKYGIKRKQNAFTKQDEESDEDVEPAGIRNGQNMFKTAKEKLVIDQYKKNKGGDRGQISNTSYGAAKRSLGTRRGPGSKFVPPVLNRDSDGSGYDEAPSMPRQSKEGENSEYECTDERLKGIDPKMIELINNEIMDQGSPITWDDIAGLEFAKKTIKEIVVWPMLRPDIFTGLRGPPKGLLLFGPPGTGKTLIGKCIASQSKSTFFCISASSLTSKWVGEGEKMVRALFAVARVHQPSVIFIDEIDSLLSQRSDNEHESSRRIKTEFLVQLDGASTGSEDRLLVIGATNRPQEIDEAARRRFVKRLLIPLPCAEARRRIVTSLMGQQKARLTGGEVEDVTGRTHGYSGADMTNLCREAALGPIRSIPMDQMETITPDQVRPILHQDLVDALRQVRASVSPQDLTLYEDWNKTYGSFGQ